MVSRCGRCCSTASGAAMRRRRWRSPSRRRSARPSSTACRSAPSRKSRTALLNARMRAARLWCRSLTARLCLACTTQIAGRAVEEAERRVQQRSRLKVRHVHCSSLTITDCPARALIRSKWRCTCCWAASSCRAMCAQCGLSAAEPCVALSQLDLNRWVHPTTEDYMWFKASTSWLAAFAR